MLLEVSWFIQVIFFVMDCCFVFVTCSDRFVLQVFLLLENKRFENISNVAVVIVLHYKAKV
jgi:hypothetical protein